MVKSSFNFKYAIRESQGDRPYQEDYCKVSGVKLGHGDVHTDAVLAVLCDGMGGHVSGEVASRSAVEAYTKAFSTTNGSIPERLAKALDKSNDALSQAIAANPELRGMGCTLVAAFVDPEGLRWVSVGDSALLLYRNGSLHRLNEDHSLGALLDKQAEAQVISKAEAENSPRRRTLRSALTGAPLALREVRDKPVKLQSGDWIIVASDGLETLSGNEIASLIRKVDAAGPSGLADTLVKAVLDRKSPNQDNITLAPISIRDPEDLHNQPTHWIQREDEDEDTRPMLTGAKKKSGAAMAVGLTFAALLAIATGVGAYLWSEGAFDAVGLGGTSGVDKQIEVQGASPGVPASTTGEASATSNVDGPSEGTASTAGDSGAVDADGAPNEAGAVRGGEPIAPEVGAEPAEPSRPQPGDTFVDGQASDVDPDGGADVQPDEEASPAPPY